MDNPLPSDVFLRDVSEDDISIFFEQQQDPEAVKMAAFPAREKDAFTLHWMKIMRDPSIVKKTVVFNGQVAGNIVSFDQFGKPQVGYWLGKPYWGKGIATKALAAFLGHIELRPLYAHVAKHNIASRRVLEKCGFTLFGEDKGFPDADGQDVEEYVLKLD